MIVLSTVCQKGGREGAALAGWVLLVLTVLSSPHELIVRILVLFMLSLFRISAC
jgi:hypothetical protein